MNPEATQTIEGRPPEKARVLLGLALGLACLRFPWLGEWSLWIDEAFMLADARHGASQLKPVSYLLFGWFYSLWPGQPPEWGLRLPAAIFGWLCVPALYWSLKPLAGRRAAALASLVLALAPWQLYWAQNARYYTLVQLLGLLGTGCLLRALMRGSLGLAGLAGLLLLAALGTHPSALILGLALFLALLGCRLFSRSSALALGAHNRKLWRLLLVVCLLSPLLLMPYVGQVSQVWETRQSHGDPVHLIKSAAYWYTPVVCLGALMGALNLVRRREQLVLVLLPSLGLAIALAATYFFRVAAQYCFVLFPFFALLAALPLGGSSTRLRTGPMRLAYGFLLLAPLVLEDGLYFGLRNGDRPHWREAFAHVMEQRRPTDLVYGMEAPVGRYYWEPLEDDLRRDGSFMFLDSWSAKKPEDWRRYGRRMWFVLNRDQTQDWPMEDRQRLLALLDEQCSLEAHFAIPWTPRDLDVFVYLFDPDWEAQRAGSAGVQPPGG